MPALATDERASSSGTAPADLSETLAPLGIASEELWALVGESEQSLRRRLTSSVATVSEPAWYADFLALWEKGGDRHTIPDLGLLECIRPLIEGALAQVGAHAEELAGALADVGAVRKAAAVRSLGEAVTADSPVAHLQTLAGPVLILELNVARVEGRLGDGEPEARFARFVQTLSDPDVRQALLAEYVVLTRMLVTRLAFWVRRRQELLDAFSEDLPRLATQLWDGRVPVVTGVSADAGDSHREGRSVAIVRTDAGPVVFKPRDIALDEAFDGFLAWTNTHLPELALARLRTVGGPERTWVEFVDTTIPTDEAGADRYARRLGGLTALLYLLHSTDFHFENVMAAGEHPYLVDLEALLHVEPMGGVPGQDERVVNAAAQVLGESVRSIGILPDRILVREEERSFAVDVSAVGGRGGQEGLVEVPTVLDAGLDTMRIAAQRHTVPAQANAPSGGDGEVLDLLRRDGPFVAGLREVYETCREHGAELLASDGPLAPFARASVRHIPRPTFQYGRLLLRSMHPDFQRDALDHLMYLGKLLSGHRGRPDRTGVIAAEIADLLVGDIPFFTVDADTGELRGGSAAVPLGRRGTPPLQAARERVEQLSPADLGLQVRIAEYSFLAASIDGEVDKWPGWTAPRRSGATVRGTRGRLAQAARAAAHELVDASVAREDHVGWIGLNLVDERWWTLSPTGLDLYSGVSGIGLGLLACGLVTEDPRILGQADRTLDQVAQQAGVMAELSADEPAKRGVTGLDAGAFGLVGGTVYALAYAAGLRGRRDWGEAGASLLPTLAKLVAVDDRNDIVSGSAGALLAALAVRPYAEEAGQQVAVEAAQRLRNTVTWSDGVASWASLAGEGQHLVGLSHGALGPAVALARLEAELGAGTVGYPDGLDDLVSGAMRHETRHLNLRTGDSADLRSVADGRGFSMRAWCHGAGGGALGRALLLRTPHLLEDVNLVRAQRDAAVRALWETGLGGTDKVSGMGNHCLCHGDVGNLLMAVTAAGDGDGNCELDEQWVAGTWAALLESADHGGWLCGVPRGVWTPGLMTGTAGIVWGLAQAASGYRLPNLLALDPATAPGSAGTSP